MGINNLHSVTLDCIMRACLNKGVCSKPKMRLLLQGYGNTRQKPDSMTAQSELIQVETQYCRAYIQDEYKICQILGRQILFSWY